MIEKQTSPHPFFNTQDERHRRWRLVLGKTSEDDQSPGEGGDGEPQSGGEGSEQLSQEDQQVDEALDGLYGDKRSGNLGDSAPDIARWLGDIRSYFPASVVQVMQQDALKRFKLRKLLSDPNVLAEIEPDIHLVSNILALNRVMPAKTRETARQVVREVVEELMEKLAYPLEQAVMGSLNRALKTRRPKHKEINWQRTIMANLKHYQPKYKTIVPEKLIGYGRQRQSLRDIIVLMDTSGSMASSVVYAGIYAAVLSKITAVSTRLIMFDTSVVELTDQLADPVDLLFGIKLGGGTNIDRALAYCQPLVTRPRDTIVVLITDLFEGGNRPSMVQRLGSLVEDGVQVVTLLALNDEGAPRFDRQVAQELVNLGIPSFACTPDIFPDLMGAVLNGRDLRQWAAGQGIVTAPDN